VLRDRRVRRPARAGGGSRVGSGLARPRPRPAGCRADPSGGGVVASAGPRRPACRLAPDQCRLPDLHGLPARPHARTVVVPPGPQPAPRRPAVPPARRASRPAGAGPGHDRRAGRRQTGSVPPARGGRGSPAGPLPARGVGRGSRPVADRAGPRPRRRRPARRGRQRPLARRCAAGAGRGAPGDRGAAPGLEIAATAPQVPSEVWLRARLAGLATTDPDQAAAHLARCEQVLAADEDWRGLVGEVALARATVALREADWRAAGVAAEQAVTVFEDHRLPWRQVAALHAWGRALSGQGRTGEAGARRGDAAAVLARIGAPQRWWTDAPSGVAGLRRPSTRPQRARTRLGP